MTRRKAAIVAAILALGVPARPWAAVQNVLVLCSTTSCEFRAAISVTFGGRTTVRRADIRTQSVDPNTLGSLQEDRIDRIPGLYRDGAGGTWYELADDASMTSVALPGTIASKASVAPGAAWDGTKIDYVAAGGKTRATASLDSFAYLLVSADADRAVFQLLERLIEPGHRDPRRSMLIQGALRFVGKSPALAQWHDSVAKRIQERLDRFEKQDGDPSLLPDVLHEAVDLRSIVLQQTDVPANKALLDLVAAADSRFSSRLAVADAFRTAAYWDEYLDKMRQVGLARWSLPANLSAMRDAAAQSSRRHQASAAAQAKDGHYDASFDEAALASRYSCEPAPVDFYNARINFVHHNQVPSAPDYSGTGRLFLEQTVRTLQQLDAAKEQVTMDTIRQGEAIDPDYLPLQLKKAEFFDVLGRYTDALRVLQRIERESRLDPKQLDVTLGLDGNTRNDLLNALKKANEDTQKAFEAGRYADAIDAAKRGLRADPVQSGLLFQSALASAFLRQNDAAQAFARSYLADSNMFCAPEGQPERMLELYRRLVNPLRTDGAAAGTPSWLSGVHYLPEQAPYDPITLGFLQPVVRITSGSRATTAFRRANRSFLVSNISTTRPSAGSFTNALATIFDVELKYDPQVLTLVSIQSPGRQLSDIAYLNSPRLDPGLVAQFTGRQVARGWAGNPFFHPFVWTGLYLFDFAYDALGRVVAATPVADEPGVRPDPFSEPLEFTWYKDTKLLQTVHGKKSGYLRQLYYDKKGLLTSETITYRKGDKGSIEYAYYSGSDHLRSAVSRDNFWDKDERVAYFEDWTSDKR